MSQNFDIGPSLYLRIDNCDERPVYKSGNYFGTKGDTCICHISPKSSYFSPSNGANFLILLKLQKKYYFHFFFIQDFPLNKPLNNLKIYKLVHNIQLEGTVSQIFYSGLRFDFMTKNGKI